MAGSKAILYAMCASFWLHALGQASPEPAIDVSIPVTIKSQFQGMPVVEPHICAHPSDPNILLVAAMVVTDVNRPYQSCRLSSFFSNDGGETWTETAHDFWGYDPWTTILASGEAVMAWLGTKGSFRHQFPIQFFASKNGGKSWAIEPQTIHNVHGHDGTKMASSGSSVYFSTVRFRGDMSADVVLYERQGRGEFQEVAQVDAQGLRLNFCEPAILTDGTVIVPASHHLRKAWIQRYTPEPSELSERYTITSEPGGGLGYMRLASDDSPGSPFVDRLYFVRAAGQQGSRGVWLNTSEDGGKSWSQDLKVDQFDDGRPSRANVASVAVNTDGVVGISWMDRRIDPDANDLYFTISTDGGMTFRRPVRVTTESSNPRTPQNADVANKFPGGGHYLGMTAKADGSFQLVWSQVVEVVFQLQTTSMSIQNMN